MNASASQTAKPVIGMGEFFALPFIKQQQAIQQRNPYGSPAHRKAFDDSKAFAAGYISPSGKNCADYFGEY